MHADARRWFKRYQRLDGFDAGVAKIEQQTQPQTTRLSQLA